MLAKQDNIQSLIKNKHLINIQNLLEKIRFNNSINLKNNQISETLIYNIEIINKKNQNYIYNNQLDILQLIRRYYSYLNYITYLTNVFRFLI